ncbi:unnamed protein product, partial [Staurois parvus]
YSGTAVGILTLGGTDLGSLTSPVTPIHGSVQKKNTDTVLMALRRKGLPFGYNERVNCVRGVFY